MEDRFKFRAWHEKLERMAYEIEVREGSSDWVDETGKSWSFESGIMQCTGPRDTNRNLIYEGDVLYFTVFDYNGADTQYKGKVVWADSMYHIVINREDDNSFDFGWVINQDDEIEIIGNIYENPELLE